MQAKRQRLCTGSELQAIHDLAELLLWIQCMHEAAMGDVAALEQLPVAREDNALLGLGDRSDLLIAIAIAVERVEAQHAQPPRQSTEVCVGDEADGPQRLRPDLEQLCNVEALELRINADVVTLFYPIRKIDRFAVHQHQFDLGVRHAERLDGVLYGRITGTPMLNGTLAPGRRQKVVQLLVEAEGCVHTLVEHRHCLASRIGLPHTSAPSRAMPRPPSFSSGTMIHEVKNRTLDPSRSDPLRPIW